MAQEYQTEHQEALSPSHYPKIPGLTDNYSEEQLIKAWDSVLAKIQHFTTASAPTDPLDMFLLFDDECLPFAVPLLEFTTNLTERLPDIYKQFCALPFDEIERLISPEAVYREDKNAGVFAFWIDKLVELGKASHPNFLRWEQKFGPAFVEKIRQQQTRLEEKNLLNPYYFLNNVNDLALSRDQFLFYSLDRTDLFSKMTAAEGLIQQIHFFKGANLKQSEVVHPLSWIITFMLGSHYGGVELGPNRTLTDEVREALCLEPALAESFLRDLGRIYDRRPDFTRPEGIPEKVGGDFEDGLKIGRKYFDYLVNDPIPFQPKNQQEARDIITGKSDETVPNNSIFTQFGTKARKFQNQIQRSKIQMNHRESPGVSSHYKLATQVLETLHQGMSRLPSGQILPFYLEIYNGFRNKKVLKEQKLTQFTQEYIRMLLSGEVDWSCLWGLMVPYIQDENFRKALQEILKKKETYLETFIKLAKTSTHPGSAAFVMKVLADLFGKSVKFDQNSNPPDTSVDCTKEQKRLLNRLFSNWEDLNNPNLAENFLVMQQYIFLNNFSVEKDREFAVLQLSDQKTVDESIKQWAILANIMELLSQREFLERLILGPFQKYELYGKDLRSVTEIKENFAKLPVFQRMGEEVVELILQQLVKSRRPGKKFWAMIADIKFPADFDADKAERQLQSLPPDQITGARGIMKTPVDVSAILPYGVHAYLGEDLDEALDLKSMQAIIRRPVIIDNQMVIEEWPIGKVYEPLMSPETAEFWGISPEAVMEKSLPADIQEIGRKIRLYMLMQLNASVEEKPADTADITVPENIPARDHGHEKGLATAVTVDIREQQESETEQKQQEISDSIRLNRDLLIKLLNGELPENQLDQVFLYRKIDGMGKNQYIFERIKTEELKTLMAAGGLISTDIFILENMPYLKALGYSLRTHRLKGGDKIFTVTRRHRSDNAEMAFTFYQDSGLPDLSGLKSYDAVMRLVADARFEDGHFVSIKAGAHEVVGKTRKEDNNVKIIRQLAEQGQMEQWMKSQARVLQEELDELARLPDSDAVRIAEIRRQLEGMEELKHKLLHNSRIIPGDLQGKIHRSIQIGLGWVETETSFNQGTFISMEEFLKKNADDIPLLSDFIDQPETHSAGEDHIREINSVEQLITYQNLKDIYGREKNSDSTGEFSTAEKNRIATREHLATLVQLFQQISPVADKCLVSSRSFDFLTISGQNGILWEVKSINTCSYNEKKRLRGALGQLLEYEFYGIQNRPEINQRIGKLTKAVLLSKRPLALSNGETENFRAYLEYLENTQGIFTYWLEDGRLSGTTGGLKRLQSIFQPAHQHPQTLESCSQN
jgi:hypothetical protein